MNFEEKNKLPKDITPEVLAEVFKISFEKINKTGKLPSSPEQLSQQTRKFGTKLVRTRIVAVIVTVILTIISICNCFFAISYLGEACSALGIFVAFSIPFLLLKEFLVGAGFYVQAQFKQLENYYREFSFEPSVQTFGGLIGLLLLVALAIIFGFASIYSSFVRIDPKSIANCSDGLTSIYFSIVTFATVGFGDIYPIGLFSRVVVSAEILIAWALLALTFSTLISWAISYAQRTQEKRLLQEEREMQMREEAIKAAGVGLYGGVDGLDKMLEEAKKRVAEKNKKSGK